MLCPVVYAWWIACLPGPLQYTLQRLIHSLSIIYSPILCIILLFNPAFSLELFMSSPATGAKLVAYLHCIQWQQSNDTNIVAIRLVNLKFPGDTVIEFEDCCIRLNTSVENQEVQLDRFMPSVPHVDKINRTVMGTLAYLNHNKSNHYWN